MKNLLIIWILIYPFWGISQEKPIPKNYYPDNFISQEIELYPKGNTMEVLFLLDNGSSRIIYFYESGNLKTVENLDRNMWRHGKYLSWYENGKKEVEYNYYESELVGSDNFLWNKDGWIESQTTCKDDTCIYTTYFESGNIKNISKVGVLGTGLLYIEERCENGQVVSVIYMGEAREDFVTYHCNGQVDVRTSVNKHGIYVGDFVTYSEDGVLRTKGMFKYHEGRNLIYVGTWLYYNEIGDLITTEIYENGVLIESIK